MNEETKKICKKYVLNNIEEYCDSWDITTISSIDFVWIDYWMDFDIVYKAWNSDLYSYEKNVLHKIQDKTKVIDKINTLQRYDKTYMDDCICANDKWCFLLYKDVVNLWIDFNL